MADKGLRSRLAAAAGLAIDDDTIDQIHRKLMAVEGDAKIPVNVKYVFSKGQDGALDVDISAKANMLLPGFKLRLSSDGDQLILFGTEESAVPEDDEPYEDDDVEEEEAPILPPKKKVVHRKSKKKPSPKKIDESENEENDLESSPGSARPSGTPSPAERIARIRAENESLYREGAITKAQAMRAGVDVDAIDGVREEFEGGDDAVGDLSPEELKALES